MKQKTKKRMQGAISLMLVIILLPMMTLSALLVDTARYNLAKSMVSSAGDLAMSSALADYDTVLKDVYGLFAMTQSETDWQSNVKQYFIETVVNEGVVSEDDAEDYVAGLLGDIKEYLVTDGNDPMNFMEMDVAEDQVTVSGVENSALSNPEVLRKQIVEFMKYRGPLTIGSSFLNSLTAFTKVSDQAEVIEKQVDAQEQLTPINEAAKKLYEWLKVFDQLYTEDSQVYEDTDGTTTTYQFDTNIKDLHVFLYGGTVEKIVDYEEVLGAIEEAFSLRYDYSNINRLYLTFFKGAYATIYDASSESEVNTSKNMIALSKKSGDYIVKSDETYSVSTAGLTSNSYSGADTNTLNTFYSALQNTLGLRTTYINKNFFSNNYANNEKTAFTIEDSAEEDFLSYTKFLKGKMEGLNYTEIKGIFENIENYTKAINAYNTAVDEKIQTYENNISECETQITQLTNQNVKLEDNINKWTTSKGQAKTRYEKLWSEIESNEEEKEQYDIVEELLQNIEQWTTAQQNVTKQSEKKAYQKQIDEANETIEEIKEKYSDIKEFYEKQDAIASYQTKISNANSTIAANKTELAKQQGTKTSYTREKKEAENEKESQKQNYQTILAQYYDFSKAYQEDVQRYWDYVTTARALLKTETTWVANVVNTIITNLKLVQTVLKNANEEAQNLLDNIDTYTNKVKEWQSATESYGDSDTGDSFYDSNMSEVEQDLKTYDKEQIKLLKEGIQDRYDNITNLIQYIEADGHYCYGVNSKKKLKDIKSVSDLRSATNNSASVELADTTTVDTFFKANYIGDNPSGDNSIVTGTFTQFDGSTYKFYYYLQSTFPETLSATQKELVKSSEQSENGDSDSVKTEYKNVKEQANINGAAQTDENGSSFGYTYKSRTSDALSDSSLPSKGTASGSSDTNKSVSISTEDDSNIASSVKDQTSVLNSVLGGIKDALTAGRDNLYILSYIFENFSYNTIVQDLGVADSVNVTLSTKASVFDPYLGTAETLTNVSIDETNNYLYGAEVEYILYGNKTPATNVTLAKGSIFATRFVFNSIYAFTNKEIKASTTAAGLAVQAATCGIVPYKVVQVVMQIALALAESAIDLQQMSMGAKVAVVKSTDTWVLGSGGLKKAAVDLVKEETKELVKAGIEAAAEKVSSKLNELTDATADNITEVAAGVIEDVSSATSEKASEIISGVFDKVENKLYEMLEALVYTELSTQAEVKTEIAAVFASVENEVDSIIDSYTDTVGQTIADVLKSQVKQLLNDAESEITSKVDDWESGQSITKLLVSEITDFKITMTGKITDQINSMQATVKNKVNTLVSQYSDKIKGYLAEGTETAKEKILDETNNYLDNTFNSISDKIDSGISTAETGVSSSAATSKTLKMGYKDYLMIFTYIAICTNDDAILKRTGDVIQLNISNASSDSDLFHKSGSGFKLSNAYTYVSLGATVDLHMLFLKLDLFSNQVDVFNDQLTEKYSDFEEMDVDSLSSFSYQGVMGY